MLFQMPVNCCVVPLYGQDVAKARDLIDVKVHTGIGLHLSQAASGDSACTTGTRSFPAPGPYGVPWKPPNTQPMTAPARSPTWLR